MNVVLTSLLITATWYFRPPLWVPLLILWVWWLAWLTVNTWRDFAAGMNYQRLKHGGKVKLPDDPDQHGNEPEIEFIVRWILGPQGTLKNFVLAQFACVLVFRACPEWPNDVGLTKLLHRMAKVPGWRGHRATRILVRYLHRYDWRGYHT